MPGVDEPIYYWNGQAWKSTPVTLDAGRPIINGLFALTPSDAYAVGNAGDMGLIYHWDGALWSIAWRAPGVELHANFIETAVQGNAIRPAPGWAPLVLLASVVFVAAILLRNWRPIIGAATWEFGN